MRADLIKLWKHAGEPLRFLIYLTPESEWPMQVCGVKFDASHTPRFVISIYEDDDLDGDMQIQSIVWQAKSDFGQEITKRLKADDIFIDGAKSPV